MSVWRRVGAMSRAELAFRLRGFARSTVQRAQTTVRGTRWDRRSVRHVLHPSLLDAQRLRLVARADWPALEMDLRARVRARPSRHVLDPLRAPVLQRQIVERFPDAPAAAAAAAEDVLSGRYDLLGHPGVSFVRGGSRVDWHADPVHDRRAPVVFWTGVPFLDAACGDHKIIWELNRHQHFLRLGRALWLTGDVRYGERIAVEVESWLEANPPLMGINWASMLELALRSLSWVAAIHFLLGGPPATADDEHGHPWLLDMLIGIDRQLEHVAQNLSRYFSPNTHLTGEALALYTVGTALPELARSARWAALGRSVLLEEIDRQICADGGHVERSTHYHRYTLDFYTLAWLTALRAGDAAAAGAFGDAVDRLATFMRALAGPDGRIPLIGDDDGGMLWPLTRRDSSDVRDSLAIASLLLDRPDLAPWPVPEEAFWLAGPQAAGWVDGYERLDREPAVETHVFSDTGCVAIRSPRRDHLVFDVGPHGFRNGGHAHADALALTLSIAGRPLLIDPGTATYTMDAGLRDRMRSSQLHNTLSLDGRSSAIPDGPFHWRTTADARLLLSRGNRGFAWVQGSHTGYGPAAHVRSIVSGDAGWLVIDAIESDVPHRADVFWHFDPAWMLTAAASGTLAAQTEDGTRVWLLTDAADLSLVRGDATTGLGWCSPRYGSLVPTWTARCGTRLAPGHALVSWIGSSAGLPALERIDARAAAAVVGVRIRRGDEATVTLLRRGGPDGAIQLDPEGYRTDARLLQVSSRGAHQVRLSMADGACAAPPHEGLLGAWADRPVRDLHIEIAPDGIDIFSTDPPSHMRIAGVPTEQATLVRLNGRERQPRGDDRGIDLHGGDWAGPDQGADVRAIALGADRTGRRPAGRSSADAAASRRSSGEGRRAG